mgnify:CR=1 FL=1
MYMYASRKASMRDSPLSHISKGVPVIQWQHKKVQYNAEVPYAEFSHVVINNYNVLKNNFSVSLG